MQAMERIIAHRPLHQRDDDDRAYWLSRTPVDRLQAVEALRQHYIAQNHVEPGLQRVHRFIGLTDLRENKRVSGRRKDLADLEALEPPTGPESAAVSK